MFAILTLQLLEFQASVVVPSPEKPVTSPSWLEPSHLQNGIGFAMTIQFQPLIRPKSGVGGIRHATLAGHAKQSAAPTQSVSVGVTYIRTALVGSQVPSFHPALGTLAVQVLENPSGDGG